MEVGFFGDVTRVASNWLACFDVMRWYRLKPMLDWNSCEAVERNPERVSGAWVFKGSRVPVRALFENIEAGATVDDFLEWFQGVSREQALSVLPHAEKSLAVA
jgi:uncharacterized protein (DUF433 family)